MTDTILAVDPGLRGCGVAYFSREAFYPTPRLRWARYVRNPVRTGDGMDAIRAVAHEVGQQGPRSHVDLLAVEFPQVYAGAKAIGDPRDLLTLAAIDGAITIQCGREVLRYFPREWKGQVDPDVLIERVKDRLDPAELARVELPAAHLAHNVWDAVGIGLKAAGRFERRIVVTR